MGTTTAPQKKPLTPKPNHISAEKCHEHYLYHCQLRWMSEKNKVGSKVRASFVTNNLRLNVGLTLLGENQRFIGTAVFPGPVRTRSSWYLSCIYSSAPKPCFAPQCLNRPPKRYRLWRGCGQERGRETAVSSEVEHSAGDSPELLLLRLPWGLRHCPTGIFLLCLTQWKNITRHCDVKSGGCEYNR